MSPTTIPGPVANQLRQGLTLTIGTAAQALEEASLIDRRNRTYEQFAEHFQLDALHALLNALGWKHEPDPVAIHVDLEPHRSAVDAGLDEAIGILRDFTDEGSPDARVSTPGSRAPSTTLTSRGQLTRSRSPSLRSAVSPGPCRFRSFDGGTSGFAPRKAFDT